MRASRFRRSSNCALFATVLIEFLTVGGPSHAQVFAGDVGRSGAPWRTITVPALAVVNRSGVAAPSGGARVSAASVIVCSLMGYGPGLAGEDVLAAIPRIPGGELAFGVIGRLTSELMSAKVRTRWGPPAKATEPTSTP